MSNIKGKLIAVIGDEDTVIGFLMSGSGELNKSRQPNYFIYDKNTSLAELEEAIRGFINRDDIAVLLIVQYVADMVRHVIDNHAKITPAILEIPSKEHAYDPSKDFILKRAQPMILNEKHEVLATYNIFVLILFNLLIVSLLEVFDFSI